MDFLGSYVADPKSPCTKQSKMNVSHFASPAGSTQPNSFREQIGTGSPIGNPKMDVPPLNHGEDADDHPVPSIEMDSFTPMADQKNLWECDTPTSMLENMSTVFLTPRVHPVKKPATTSNEEKNVDAKQNVDSGPLSAMMGFFKNSN